MPVYSFSQIKVFEQCPLKYRYQYIDKIKVDQEPQSPHLLLGSAVHHALEFLYKQLNEFHTPSKEAVVSMFHQYWESEIDRDEIIFPDDTPEDVFIRRGIVYVETYYTHHAPFDKVSVVATEGNIVFSLDSEGQIKFRGMLDRLDKEGNAFIINDYKTNKHLPPEDKTMYQEQLSLYALGVQEKYGKYFDVLKARLHYLHFDIIDEREITDELTKPIINKYSAIVRDIEDRRFHANMGATDRFPATENTGCRFCPYMSICPLWAHASMDDEVIIGDKTAKQLVDEYGDLSTQVSNITKQKEVIKEILTKYVQQKKLEKLFGDTWQLSAKPSTYYGVKDTLALEHYLREQGLLTEYQSIDRHALTRGIKEHELDLAAIQDMLSIKESVTLRASKKK